MGKKVTFSSKNDVHIMVVWQYAYRAYRKKYWEFFPLDRIRFKDRIDKISKIVTPILNCEHRNKVYEERFNDEEEDYIEFKE